jgi:hypothetical protein
MSDGKSSERKGETLASGVTEPGTLEQQAWNLYYDRHAKVAEEIVESLIIFAAPLRERVAELERDITFWHQAHDGAEARREDSEKQATALREERDRLESVLVNVLASATPNQKEYPRMFAAWADARAALSPHSQDGKKGGE